MGVALDYRFRPANMNASMKRNLPRADLYNVANYWGRWEDELTAAGFGNGALYKKFLLDSPYLDHKDSDLYDLLAREAWKERWSKDIQWDELPSTYEIDQDKRIYRSPHVDKTCALWSVERSHVKEVSLSKPPEVQNPYEMARRCFWSGALCSEEEAFRDSLLEAIDDVRCIELMRSFSDPVGKPVTAREVGKCIDGFCANEGGFTRWKGGLPKNRFVVSFDLGSDLHLCFGIHEIQKKSYGHTCFRLHDLISLVRSDQIESSHQFSSEHPSRIQALPMMWGGYDVRDNTPIDFYVALAFRLRVYQLLCKAFVKFFRDVE